MRLWLVVGTLLVVAACAGPGASGSPSASGSQPTRDVGTPCGGGAWPPVGQPAAAGITLAQVNGGTIRVENRSGGDAWVDGPSAAVYAELLCVGWMAEDPGNDTLVLVPNGGEAELSYTLPVGWPGPYRALVSVHEQPTGETVSVAWLELTTTAAASSSAGPAGSTAPTTEVRVYFTLAGAGDPCTVVAPVVRQLAGPVTPEVALRELLRGPNEGEATVGFTSWFGPATADALQEVRVTTDGIARVSFRDFRSAIPGASSTCGSSALLTALDATLAEFPAIRGARYSFGGDEVAFYEWLGLAPPD